MKAIYFIILAIFIPTITLGQTINDSLLATFYNKTLKSYFPDTVTNKDQTKYGSIIIETLFDTSKLVKIIGTNKFKFIRGDSNIISNLSKPIKKNKGRSVYVISHQIFGQDTIDINIEGLTIGDVNKKLISLGVWCGGVWGYIPDARYVCIKPDNNWKYISTKEIIQKKIDDEKKSLEKYKKQTE